MSLIKYEPDIEDALNSLCADFDTDKVNNTIDTLLTKIESDDNLLDNIGKMMDLFIKDDQLKGDITSTNITRIYLILIMQDGQQVKVLKPNLDFTDVQRIHLTIKRETYLHGRELILTFDVSDHDLINKTSDAPILGSIRDYHLIAVYSAYLNYCDLASQNKFAQDVLYYCYLRLLQTM